MLLILINVRILKIWNLIFFYFPGIRSRSKSDNRQRGAKQNVWDKFTFYSIFQQKYQYVHIFFLWICTFRAVIYLSNATPGGANIKSRRIPDDSPLTVVWPAITRQQSTFLKVFAIKRKQARKQTNKQTNESRIIFEPLSFFVLIYLLWYNNIHLIIQLFLEDQLFNKTFFIRYDMERTIKNWRKGNLNFFFFLYVWTAIFN